MDPAEKAHREMDWIAEISRMGIEPHAILEEMLEFPDYSEFFSDKNRKEHVLKLLNMIYRNARIYGNKGHTLNELEIKKAATLYGGHYDTAKIRRI